MPVIPPAELHREDVEALLDLLNSILARNVETVLNADSVCNSIYSDNIPSVVPCENFLETFRASRTQSMRLKGISSALRILGNSLEEVNNRTERCISTIAMHFGLTKLPDELLLRILWHAASTFSDAVQLCEVCTRFRSVLLSTPEIWAKFPLTVNALPAQIKAIVERSGGMPLKARIEPILFFPLNANAILDHSTRLEELVVSSINDPVLRPRFDTIHLPGLRSLSMSWSKYVRNERGPQTATAGPTSHIYENWSMPQLLSLEANFIPHPFHGSSIAQCELSFDEDSIHVNELLSFLASSSQLKKVKISFAHTSAWRDSRPDQSVRLANLRSLSIHTSGETSTSLLNRVLSSLSCEGLSEVSFDMKSNSLMDATHRHAFGMDHETERSGEDSVLKGWAEVAIRFIQRQRCIRILNIAVNVPPRDDKAIPLAVAQVIHDISSNIPGTLDTLVLSHCITISWSSTPTEGRRIRCLRVTDANSYTVSLLQIVKPLLICKGLQPERLIIDGCRQSEEHELRALYFKQDGP